MGLDMGTKTKRMMTAMTAASITATLVWAVPAGAGGRPFEIALSGAEEVAGNPPARSNPHGDADRGSVRIALNQGQGEVCYEFGELTLTAGDALPSAGHIHRAPAGQPGPIVVTLFGQPSPAPIPAPAGYPTEETCVEGVDPELIKEIRQNPEQFYVNLHNQQHPTGVVRGQLG